MSHSVNVTPMSDGMLRGLDSTAFLGQGHDHQTSHRNAPTDFKARQLKLCHWRSQLRNGPYSWSATNQVAVCERWCRFRGMKTQSRDSQSQLIERTHRPKQRSLPRAMIRPPSIAPTRKAKSAVNERAMDSPDTTRRDRKLTASTRPVTAVIPSRA